MEPLAQTGCRMQAPRQATRKTVGENQNGPMTPRFEENRRGTDVYWTGNRVNFLETDVYKEGHYFYCFFANQTRFASVCKGI